MNDVIFGALVLQILTISRSIEEWSYRAPVGPAPEVWVKKTLHHGKVEYMAAMGDRDDVRAWSQPQATEQEALVQLTQALEAQLEETQLRVHTYALEEDERQDRYAA